MIKNLNFRILTLIFQIFKITSNILVVYCCIFVHFFECLTCHWAFCSIWVINTNFRALTRLRCFPLFAHFRQRMRIHGVLITSNSQCLHDTDHECGYRADTCATVSHSSVWPRKICFICQLRCRMRSNKKNLLRSIHPSLLKCWKQAANWPSFP